MRTTRTVGRSVVAAIGLIALTVFAAVPAEGFGHQTVAEPIVGPELPVSYPAMQAKVGEAPAVAFGGSVFLTAWRDYDRGIVAARVNRAGTVIDVLGIDV